MKEARKRVTLLNWNDTAIVVSWAFLTEAEAHEMAQPKDSEDERWQVVDGWIEVATRHVQEEPS